MRRSLVLALCLSTLAALSAHAQLSVAMTADKTSIVAGNFVTYTIVVTNNGPAAAANVRVSDPLTTLFSYVNFLGPGCSFGLGGASCSFSSMGATAVVPVTFSVRNVFGGAISGEFQAHVSSTTHDPDPSNNDALVQINGN
jgi:uncharacterized repeat protein (TIGR01451 family)